MTIKLIATSLDNGLIKTVQARPVAPPNRSFCLEHLPPLLVLERYRVGKVVDFRAYFTVEDSRSSFFPPRPVDLYFSFEFSPASFRGGGWRERQAFHLRLLRVGTRRSWVGAGCISEEKTWARQTGRGRGLTAPSRAASYHGPMPTLSTCPSWNKDGRGLQQHPRQGYPRGIALGGVRACVYESYKRGEGFRSMHAPRQT